MGEALISVLSPILVCKGAFWIHWGAKHLE